MSSWRITLESKALLEDLTVPLLVMAGNAFLDRLSQRLQEHSECIGMHAYGLLERHVVALESMVSAVKYDCGIRTVDDETS